MFISGTLLFSSCNKDTPQNPVTSFTEDFESANVFEDLFPSNLSRWSGYQKESPPSGENLLEVDTSVFHSGSRAFRFTAEPSASKFVSKCDLQKEELDFKEGETFYFSCWYYLKSNENLDWLFLFDLEETVVDGASPGLRIALLGEKGYLAVERGKMELSTLRQAGTSQKVFPRYTWTKVELEVKLSRRKKGHIRLWQDGQIILSVFEIQTMPRDILYFTHGTKGIYDRIQVGITANSKNNPAVLLVDDVVISKK